MEGATIKVHFDLNTTMYLDIQWDVSGRYREMVGIPRPVRRYREQ